MNILRTASLGFNFTGSYKRKSVFERISFFFFFWSLDLKQEFIKLTHLPLTPPLLYLKSFQLLQNTGKPWKKGEHWYRIGDNWLREAATRRCSLKKVFWKLRKRKQENTCARASFLIKLQDFPLRVFSVNMTKSTVSCRFGRIYWRNPWWKTSFFVRWKRCTSR